MTEQPRHSKAADSSPLPAVPPEGWEPLLRLARLASRPLERFLQVQAASGIVLLLATLVALVWANSRWAHTYHHLWQTPIGVQLGAFSFSRPLEWVVNDGLMVIFFFFVGVEIRREIHHGELSEWRRAALPALAALGGMIVPALLYLTVAYPPATRHGWGVPMATDIAFAVGVLTLLGKRVPPALRVLLLALAVVDDLGAILVIALFYSSGIAWLKLLLAAGAMAVIFAMQAFGVRAKLAYVAPALVAWAAVYAAGVHPTIAGVAVGLATPVRAWLGPDGFVEDVRRQIDAVAGRAQHSHGHSEELVATLRAVDRARREAISPAESLIETLHPWVAFGIMPLFALANAGVNLSNASLAGDQFRVALGAAMGLLVGKPLGVVVVCLLGLRLGMVKLPAGLGSRHLIVLGMVAGIGFTMALFVAQLAFESQALLSAAKLGVLFASGAAAIVGIVSGAFLLRSQPHTPMAASADEAESSTDQ